MEPDLTYLCWGSVCMMACLRVLFLERADAMIGLLTESEPDTQPEDYSNIILTGIITVLGTLLCVFLIWLCYRKWCNRQQGRGEQSAVGQYRGDGQASPPSYSSTSANAEHPTLVGISNDIIIRDIEMNVVQVETQRNCVRTDTGQPDENPLLKGSPENQDTVDIKVRDLFSVTERSSILTVSGKLLVTVAHNVDHRGDVLFLDNVGISLTIPPGAIPEGRTETICLALNWDLSDSPEMEPREALVSPVVYCGPHGLQLRKPCILSYRHCAYDPGDIKIMVSETQLTDRKDWQMLCEAREVEGKCEVTQEDCRVNLDHFSLISCIQSRPDESHGKKWLQIAVFTTPLRKGVDHYQVRVYFLNKTPCALEWATQNEASFGGSKCCPEKVFLYDGDGKDMFLEMVYLSDDWEVIGGCQFERISFLQIWHGKCPHVSMCVRRKVNPRMSGREINLHFLAYQDEHANNPERLVIHMTEEANLTSRTSESYCSHHGLGRVTVTIPDSTYPSTSASTVQVTSDADQGTSVDIRLDKHNSHIDLENVNRAMSSIFTIPEALKQKLTLLLDPHATFGNNWRQLAMKLNLDGAIRFLETFQSSPTMALLQFMEQKDMRLERLCGILDEMGRKDASLAVAYYIPRDGEEHQDASTNGRSEGYSE